MNSLFVIQPYKRAGTWAFDDERVGLLAEPFVAGIPAMIERLVTDIPDAHNGFRLLFAPQAFPGAQVHLERAREEAGGWWYRAVEYESEGWLCPALFKYFEAAPPHLWVRAEALEPTS